MQKKIQKIQNLIRNSQIKRILGCDIEAEKALTILERLGFSVLGKNDMACKFCDVTIVFAVSMSLPVPAIIKIDSG